MHRRELLQSLAAIPVAANVSRLDLAPHDVIVITCDQIISCDTADRIKRILEETFPGHRALVLGDGLKISILRRDR